MELSMAVCKRRLAVVWFVFSAIIVSLLVVQTLGGHYGEYIENVWSWFIPLILPTLMLMIGTFTVDVSKDENVNVSKFYYKLSLYLSYFYLALLLLTILVQPFLNAPPKDVLQMSNFWLGPVQGLVAAALGMFFLKRGEGQKK